MEIVRIKRTIEKKTKKGILKKIKKNTNAHTRSKRTDALKTFWKGKRYSYIVRNHETGL